MNFCSECGSSELEIKIPGSDNRARTVCNHCGKVHYINPRIVVGCVPVWENKVLLCRRAIEPRLGLWNLPAGFLELDETLEQGAVREVFEEAKAQVIINNLLAIYSNTRHHYVYVHFVADIKDGRFGIGEESLESRLFSEEEILREELAFHSSEHALQCYFENQKNGYQKVHVGSWPY